MKETGETGIDATTNIDLLRKTVQIVMLYFLIIFILSKRANAEVWGDVNLGIYPVGHIVAANGLTYKPLFRLGADLNIGTRDLYIFSKNYLFAEKPAPGVTTNSNQGNFDFSKREFDFKIGLAARPFTDNSQLEFRLWAVSLNNLNRGKYQDRPSGFKDGVAVETRYYLTGKRTWGYVAGGYYLTKELVQANGEAYKPGMFVGSRLNYDILTDPQKLYAFMNVMVVNMNGLFKGGLAWRPFKKSPDTEIRLSESWYMNIRERGPNQNALFFELIHYFGSR